MNHLDPPPPDEHLESELRALTAWAGPDFGLADRALRERGAHRNFLDGVLASPKLRLWIGAAALVVFAVTASLVTLQSLTGGVAMRPPTAMSLEPSRDKWASMDDPVYAFGASKIDVNRADVRMGAGFEATADIEGQPVEGGGRLVIHKATIEIVSPDVRAVMLKAGLLVNEATGEYIQSSSLTGEGPATSGDLTLRIASARLSEVLNALRGLGTVRNEATTGDDVTDHAVDLGARLRNEQRVEEELLALLDARTDAPLKEVLELRTAIGQVRENIERLTAQRQNLERSVSLATILVLIRPEGVAVPESKPAELAAYFGTSIARAWQTGLYTLIDLTAMLVRILIAGVMWWVLAIVAYILIRRKLMQGRGPRANA